MDKKDLEQLINILKNQSEINTQIRGILEYMTPGSSTPQLTDLKEIMKDTHTSLLDFEKKIKESEG
ncbi:hypothetical protein [Chryseobacterium sp. SIMBA_029]|uniref:hypothetical protein n=1 Tax=Chryseobacterium sp. SIMBA_029 TaxID=3085772 RepID=UPI003979FBF3